MNISDPNKKIFYDSKLIALEQVAAKVSREATVTDYRLQEKVRFIFTLG